LGKGRRGHSCAKRRLFIAKAHIAVIHLLFVGLLPNLLQLILGANEYYGQKMY
jgi:hypothetical protein